MESRKSHKHSIRYQCALSVPKDLEDQKARNEDYYQLSQRLGVFAICDGASISYDSAEWSKIVARRYCSDRSLSRDWLLECIGAFRSKHDRESLPWAKQAAYDRGSYSSLLGVVTARESDQVKLFAVGDTVAILCDGNKLIGSFPLDDPSCFDDSPSLLSTIPDLNSFEQDGRLNCRQEEWSISGLADPILFCMTDALGRWFLENAREHPEYVEKLRTWCSTGDRASFRQFVIDERKAARLRKDDTTLLAFWCDICHTRN